VITLTKEEAQQVLDALRGDSMYAARQARETLRARLAQPEPEPMAWMHSLTGGGWQVVPEKLYPTDQPLYSAPPQREWQGLTEGETIKLALDAFQLPEFSLEARLKMQNELVKAMNEPDSRLMIFAATIETKLKEKNNG
jgi:hypothetical protein